MRQMRTWGVVVVLVLLLVVWLNGIGEYFVAQIQNFQENGQAAEPQAEEKVIHEMVLQLEPIEYYTFQLGSYSNVKDGQAKIDAMAQLGYRLFASDGPPYQLCLGCFGTALNIEVLPEVIRNENPDLFVQKKLLNETTLRFPSEDRQKMEPLASLLSSYDIVLKHSLKMFQDIRYEACDTTIWEEMIAQITEELSVIQQHKTTLLEEPLDEPLISACLNLFDVTEEYAESLQRIQEQKKDQAVLLAQSCLLEVIQQYHALMRSGEDVSS